MSVTARQNTAVCQERIGVAYALARSVNSSVLTDCGIIISSRNLEQLPLGDGYNMKQKGFDNRRIIDHSGRTAAIIINAMMNSVATIIQNSIKRGVNQ